MCFTFYFMVFFKSYSVCPAELSAFCGGVLCFLWAVVGCLQGQKVELDLLLRALLLSSYGKILLIPAVIWEHDYSPLCLGFVKLFVLTSNSQAIRGRTHLLFFFYITLIVRYSSLRFLPQTQYNEAETLTVCNFSHVKN